MTTSSKLVTRFQMNLPRSLVQRKREQAKEEREQHCLRWSIRRRIGRQSRSKVS